MKGRLKCGRRGGQDVLGGVGSEEGRDGVGGCRSSLQLPQNHKAGENELAKVTLAFRLSVARARRGSVPGSSLCGRRAEIWLAPKELLEIGSSHTVSRSLIAVRVFSVRTAELLARGEIPADRATAWLHEGHGAALARGRSRSRGQRGRVLELAGWTKVHCFATSWEEGAWARAALAGAEFGKSRKG